MRDPRGQGASCTHRFHHTRRLPLRGLSTPNGGASSSRLGNPRVASAAGVHSTVASFLLAAPHTRRWTLQSELRRPEQFEIEASRQPESRRSSSDELLVSWVGLRRLPPTRRPISVFGSRPHSSGFGQVDCRVLPESNARHSTNCDTQHLSLAHRSEPLWGIARHNVRVGATLWVHGLPRPNLPTRRANRGQRRLSSPRCKQCGRCCFTRRVRLKSKPLIQTRLPRCRSFAARSGPLADSRARVL